MPFNDEKVGGVGSGQVMRPVNLDKGPTIMERLADIRLSLRLFDAAASSVYDGSVSCLSGRTAMYRTVALLHEDFVKEFTEELWCPQCAPLAVPPPAAPANLPTVLLPLRMAPLLFSLEILWLRCKRVEH